MTVSENLPGINGKLKVYRIDKLGEYPDRELFEKVLRGETVKVIPEAPPTTTATPAPQLDASEMSAQAFLHARKQASIAIKNAANRGSPQQQQQSTTQQQQSASTAIPSPPRYSSARSTNQASTHSVAGTNQATAKEPQQTQHNNDSKK